MPAALTISALAKHYEVSFSPVRRAVQNLTARGLLIKTENGRLSRAKIERAEASGNMGETVLPSPPQNTYRIIANDLVDLSLEGESVYLREEATAQKYGISRSAVRNVFHRLAGSGMLDHIPRRGWQLRVFRQQDLADFCEAREVLELKALELAEPHLVEADLKRMLDHNCSKQGESMIDNSLHAYFIDKADNFYIKDFFERHGSYFSLIFRWEAKDRDAAKDAAQDHRKILRALLNKEWHAARKALSEHIHFNHPVLKKI